MDASTGSIIGKSVGAFTRSLFLLSDALIDRIVRDQPRCL
jgi:hypothetical protein